MEGWPSANEGAGVAQLFGELSLDCQNEEAGEEGRFELALQGLNATPEQKPGPVLMELCVWISPDVHEGQCQNPSPSLWSRRLAIRQTRALPTSPPRPAPELTLCPGPKPVDLN
ncbi:hypothetical protein SKAU_G00118760 [Synaphobranchus kaupii]|uniref:Uncharacterized protein n=1 Tax=Synaphobranchus kaupii TaxID=118154 RepID=A0A9Q1FNQ8_SYNKA|nr:hypothetical protein SKAU_G00118760 [Synaphobranchus kaupii]